MSFEEKVLNSLAEIHQRLGGVEGRLTGVEDRLTGVEGRITGVEDRLSSVERSVILIENDHGAKLDALFEGYEQNTQAINELRKDVRSLEERVTTQEIKLRLVK